MHRGWKWLLGSLAGVLALVGAAWLGLPPLVQSQLQTRGSEALGRDLRVQRVEFSPFTLTLTLHGLSLAGREAGAPPQLEIARVLVDADLRSLLRLAPVIERLEVDAPQARLARLGDGRLDIDDILERLARPPSEPPPAAEPPQRFALFNLQLRDGALRFDDRAVGRGHAISGLQLALPFLSNLPDDLAVQVEPRLAFALDGHPVDLRGRTLPFAPDRASELVLELDGAELGNWWAYLPATLPLLPHGGSLSAKLALSFAQPGGGHVPQVALSGQATLQRLALRKADGTPMLAWQTLAVGLKDVRPLERQVALGAVTLDGAEIEVRRAADGSLEWVGLGGGTTAAPARPAAPGSVPPAPSASAPASSPARPPAAAAGATPWQVAVDQVDLRGAQVRWQDASLRPAATYALEDLSLSTKHLRWPMADPVSVQAQARLSAAGAPAGQVTVGGEVSDRTAKLGFTLDALRLGAAAPYLRPVLRPALEGQAQIAGGVDWAGGTPGQLQLRLEKLQLDALRLTEPGQRRPALQLASATLGDARVDLNARRVMLGRVALSRPQLQLRRSADGRVNAQAWLVNAAPERSAGAASPGRPAGEAAAAEAWSLSLGQAQLDGGSVSWRDAAARPGTPVALDLLALRAGLQDFSWPAQRQAAQVNLAAQLRVPPEPGATAESPGRLQARGTLRLAPVPAWRGRVEVERWPVAAFEPYFGQWLPVQVRSAELGVRGDVHLQLPPHGPRLEARGELLLADVSVLGRPGAAGAGEELMAWQALSLKPVRVAMAPATKPRVEIGEILWSEFYSRLVIAEDGSFNLRDVGAAARGGAEPAPPAGAASAASAAAPASAASASPSAAGANASAAAGTAAPGELPLDLVVERTRLVNGRVDFTDRFIKPNYSAALSELEGTLGRVDSRTRDMATLEVKGRAAGTALLEVRGALNPTARPLALDISARATDLELAPLTPYAGKYAGYAIERGKLSMDVAYRIDPDGRLEAKNQVILNQLTFGDKIDSPDATKLPVRLAAALLTDRNGVIDLNLPISGSINDPKFSIWGIVWRLIGNLLVKALTAPFALLAGTEKDDLSVVPFVAGTATLATESANVIERVAKALTDRPALRMTVTGAADPVREQEAIRRAVLESRIAVEQRRERARAGAAASAASAPLPALTPAQRTAIVKRLYTEARLPDKPRNVIGLLKDLPLPEMEARLMAAIAVTPDTARELAIQRGLAVRDALIAQGLPSERLFLGAPQVHAAGGADDASWTPRVQLLLQGP